MASDTKRTERRRKNRHKAAGRRRKIVESKHSTDSYTDLFAACGEVGKPAPKA